MATDLGRDPALPQTDERGLALDGMSVQTFIQTAHRHTSGDPVSGLLNVRELLTNRELPLGVIYTFEPARDRIGCASACVHETRKVAPNAEILLDANRYSGRNRSVAGVYDLDDSWIRKQHNLGLRWALTDSGYISGGDRPGLLSLLGAADRLHQKASTTGRGVITVLPLSSRWITHDADALTDAIKKQSAPVALILEDERDPLALKDAVEGLIHIFSTGHPTGLLRSDTSALGALALGAWGVGVGDRPSRRHLYPATQNGGPTSAKPAMFVPELLGYFHHNRLDNAITALPEAAAWYCPCSVCAGRRLDWITSSATPLVDSFRHSLSAMSDVAQNILKTNPSSLRLESWLDMTSNALYTTNELEADGALVTPNAALSRWSEAIDEYLATEVEVRT